MSLVVILPTRQNQELADKIQSGLDKSDRLIAADFPKLPARKLDEIIWKNIPDQDSSILFISPAVVDVSNDFILVFKTFASETDSILIRSPFEEFDDFYHATDLGLLTPKDSILFRKSLYRRQLMDISPQVDYSSILRELIKSLGRGSFYTPLRNQKKLIELFRVEEEMKKIEEEKKKEILVRKLNSIRERRIMREQDRNKSIQDLEKLREEISRLEEEVSRQEEELSRQEQEFKNSEAIIANEIRQKEEAIKSVRLRLADKEIFLKRIKDANVSRQYIKQLNEEIEDFKKKEIQLLETLPSPPPSSDKNSVTHKVSLKKRIEQSKDPKRPPKERRSKEWMRENPDIRSMVLSKEPTSSEKITKVKKLDWD